MRSLASVMSVAAPLGPRAVLPERQAGDRLGPVDRAHATAAGPKVALLRVPA